MFSKMLNVFKSGLPEPEKERVKYKSADGVVQRFPQNPLLRPEDFLPSRPDWKIECLLNPGVFRFQNRTWLVVRVAERPPQQKGRVTFPILSATTGEMQILEFAHDDPLLDRSDPRVLRHDGVDYLTTLSHLRLLVSENGVQFQEVDKSVLLHGRGALETYGIEDCRVSQIDGAYYLSYTAVSPNGVAVGMRSTKDWKSFREHGLIFPPHNKDCALFEEKINGNYYALHRPSSVQLGGNYIWLAESPDLSYWGKHICLARTRPGMWDSARVGAGAAPIRTPHGWLAIYHGADKNNRYCLGGLLLDLDQPWKVLARSHEPLMEPDTDYECNGFFGKVIFTNGHVVDGDEITLYYGAADMVVCGAKLQISKVLDTLMTARKSSRVAIPV